MRSYAEREVFTDHETDLLHQADSLVQKVPDEIRGQEVRCHELARAVGFVLGLEVADGHFGFVEHSWLWTTPFRGPCGPSWGLPNILDVYVPGAFPQVQLVSTEAGLPHRYSPRPVKDLVIRTDVFETLILIMKGARS